MFNPKEKEMKLSLIKSQTYVIIIEYNGNLDQKKLFSINVTGKMLKYQKSTVLLYPCNYR